MKKTIYLLFFLYSSLFAQEEYVPIDFGELVPKICPFDSTITNTQLEDWIVYQTLDSTWNGEIDSSRCISLTEHRRYPAFRISDIDKTKPVFVRRIFNDNTKPLLFPDFVYLTYGQISIEDNVMLKEGVDCPDDLCTGVIVGIDVPNEAEDGRNVRYYQIASDTETNTQLEACIPTEKFPDNHLGEFIYKFFVQEDSPDDGLINLFLGGMEINHFTGRIYDIMLDERYRFDDRYQVYVGELSDNMAGFGSHLLMYKIGDQYPSLSNPHYIEAQPVPNTDEVERIDIDMGYETLIHQPFTYLRGALIVGSDSLRHEVNLINDGGELCILFIEVLFEENTHYHHKGGKINMDGRTACLLFQRGGSMNIAPGVHLEYGKLSGDGAIALGRDGHLNLEKNSSMTINNRFVLMEKSRDDNEQTYVNLKAGSKLVFGKTATLEKNTAFEDGKMRLNVFMNGGTLDDSQLSEEEKKLINRIYPKEPIPLFESIQIYPNPISDRLWVDIPMEARGEVELKLMDLKGRLVKKLDKVLDEGNQTVEMEIDEALTGVYVLKVLAVNGLISKELIKKVILSY